MTRYRLFLFTVLLFPLALRAQLVVDCSGHDQSAYPSINAALADAGSGSTIYVTGPCTEDVTLENVNNISLGAWPGQSAKINGTIIVADSHLVYLYGLNVTSSNASGFDVVHSNSIAIDSCNASGNAVVGLSARFTSDVFILTLGTFDNNAGNGIYVDGNSTLLMLGYGGTIDVSDNGNSGIYSSGGMVSTWGNTTILDNSGGNGLGIELLGGARLQVGAVWGPNTIQGNPSGGASVKEGSEASFWNINGLISAIQGNGPTGIAAGFGSQVTIYDGDNISDHTGAGVDVFGHSMVYLYGNNSIYRNGTLHDRGSAGVRVDGSSEAFIRGGNIYQNYGPGLLGLVSSSVDFSDATFSQNAGGIIECDNSSWMLNDAEPGAGVRCRSPHKFGNRRMSFSVPPTPSVTRYKALQTKYKKMAPKR